MKKLFTMMAVFCCLQVWAAQWEYRIVNLTDMYGAEQLNDLGMQGWELASVHPESGIRVEWSRTAFKYPTSRFIFKRPAGTPPVKDPDLTMWITIMNMKTGSGPFKNIEFGIEKGKRCLWISESDFAEPEAKAFSQFAIFSGMNGVAVYELKEGRRTERLLEFVKMVPKLEKPETVK